MQKRTKARPLPPLAIAQAQSQHLEPELHYENGNAAHVPAESARVELSNGIPALVTKEEVATRKKKILAEIQKKREENHARYRLSKNGQYYKPQMHTKADVEENRKRAKEIISMQRMRRHGSMQELRDPAGERST